MVTRILAYVVFVFGVFTSVAERSHLPAAIMFAASLFTLAILDRRQP